MVPVPSATAIPADTRAPHATESRVRITEIFYSLQGEARTVGWPTVFVRLTGCPLRCQYCDTTYAFHGGDWFTFEEVERRVGEYTPRYVTVTGGEPLAQSMCRSLLARLAECGYEVSLETSGALDIAGIDARVSVVMDLKTPGSGEVARNRYENIPLLKRNDQVKFVICGRADYEWSRTQAREHDLSSRCEVLFSPSYGQMAPSELADWILADRLPVRMQLQLHKVLWGDTPGR
jgi:7-carboxy-7-deazaguanine synthase